MALHGNGATILGLCFSLTALLGCGNETDTGGQSSDSSSSVGTIQQADVYSNGMDTEDDPDSQTAGDTVWDPELGSDAVGVSDGDGPATDTTPVGDLDTITTTPDGGTGSPDGEVTTPDAGLLEYEICGNLADDDGNGLIDCGDPECYAECESQTCTDYNWCLVQSGCGCTKGIDCPEQDSEIFECYLACASNTSCTNGCTSSMTPEVLADLSAYQLCASFHCTGLQGEQFNACTQTNCLEEIAECYYAGDMDCGEVFFGCYGNCAPGDKSCYEACNSQLSEQGYIDAVLWSNCRADLCDYDGDGQPDAPLCTYLGGFVACAHVGPSCMSQTFLDNSNATDCAGTTTCLFDCPWTDIGCLYPCIENQSSDDTGTTSALFYCVIESCGGGEDDLTKECGMEALGTDCATDYSACMVKEVCDSTLDDDGDGLIDCADSDCIYLDVCSNTPGLGFKVRINDGLSECTDIVDTGMPGADILKVQHIHGSTVYDGEGTSLEQGVACALNAHTDLAALLSPDSDQFVSLNGGSLTVEFPKVVMEGDTIIVSESDVDLSEQYSVWLYPGIEGSESAAFYLGTATGDSVFEVPAIVLP